MKKFIKTVLVYPNLCEVDLTRAMRKAFGLKPYRQVINLTLEISKNKIIITKKCTE